jgi:hypothetical protein
VRPVHWHIILFGAAVLVSASAISYMQRSLASGEGDILLVYVPIVTVIILLGLVRFRPRRDGSRRSLLSGRMIRPPSSVAQLPRQQAPARRPAKKATTKKAAAKNPTVTNSTAKKLTAKKATAKGATANSTMELEELRRRYTTLAHRTVAAVIEAGDPAAAFPFLEREEPQVLVNYGMYIAGQATNYAGSNPDLVPALLALSKMAIVAAAEQVEEAHPELAAQWREIASRPLGP